MQYGSYANQHAASFSCLGSRLCNTVLDFMEIYCIRILLRLMSARSVLHSSLKSIVDLFNLNKILDFCFSQLDGLLCSNTVRLMKGS